MRACKAAKTPSSGIIRYPVSKGYTQRKIAQIIEARESFIRHVVKGTRNLTVDDMHTLSEHGGMTLSELLALATPVEQVPKKFRKCYRLFLTRLEQAEELRKSMAKKENVKARQG